MLMCKVLPRYLFKRRWETNQALAAWLTSFLLLQLAEIIMTKRCLSLDCKEGINSINGWTSGVQFIFNLLCCPSCVSLDDFRIIITLSVVSSSISYLWSVAFVQRWALVVIKRRLMGLKKSRQDRFLWYYILTVCCLLCAKIAILMTFWLIMKTPGFCVFCSCPPVA